MRGWSLFFNLGFLGPLLFVPFMVLAHGVQGKVGSGGVVVKASYDTGEAMSYARVDIAAPGAKLPFQSGRTDRNGCFCFLPDVPGQWKITIKDGQGHQLNLRVDVDQAMKIVSMMVPGLGGMGINKRWKGVVMGLCVVFGLAGASVLLFQVWPGKKGDQE